MVLGDGQKLIGVLAIPRRKLRMDTTLRPMPLEGGRTTSISRGSHPNITTVVQLNYDKGLAQFTHALAFRGASSVTGSHHAQE